MSKLSEKSLKILEYYTILDQLAEKCVSRKAKQAARNLRPLHDIEDVQELLTQTDDAKRLLTTGGTPAFGGIREVSAALSRSKMGGILSTRELLDIASLLHAANQVRKYGNEQQDNGVHTSLDTMFARINSNRYLEEKINRAIISEEEIADAASSELANIRRQIRQQNVHVRETLNHYVSSATYSKYLQETIITQRDGRYVIPVKSEHKGDVPGMVHDISSSGATLFIEPTQVVNANNQIKILQGKEKAEIERILAELTADVEGFSEAIAADYDVLCKLDFIFAKANYSFQLNACSPKLSEKTQVQLIQARHPLLDQKKAVAIDIALGCDYDTLVITGPNTGGKTVSLKTLGLLSLMAASGLHIPANEESKVCLFQNIYADIGDEQSIEQSLSTFSAHMKNTVSIMEKCGPDDLILFDELGAGTDPEEGAALAVAIIEYGRKMGSLVAATTHYSELKVFALTTEGVENASCEFDVRTLQPTYRLLTGVPGKSNAFEISKRLGLDEGVIDRARTYLKGEDVHFEDIISSAQSRYQLAEEERAMASAARRDLDKLRQETEAERRKLEADRAKYQAKAKDEARRIVEDTRREMDKLIADIRSIKGVDRSAADRVIQQSRDALRKRRDDLAEKLVLNKEDGTKPPKTVNPGDTVRIVSLDKKATVLSKPDSKGEVQVQAGVMKLNAKLADLRMMQDDTPQKGVGKIRLEKDRQVGMELDIRGMLVDDAILVVDRYIDNAVLSGLTEINIIHGKGTGALRAGIQDYLRTNKRVKSFRLGNYGEGDAGVTVVTLKETKQ